MILGILAQIFPCQERLSENRRYFSPKMRISSDFRQQYTPPPPQTPGVPVTGGFPSQMASNAENKWPAPSHYLNQCWNIVNFSEILIEIHTFPFENAIWKMAAILSKPQCVNSSQHCLWLPSFFAYHMTTYRSKLGFHRRGLSNRSLGTQPLFLVITFPHQCGNVIFYRN